MVEEIPNNFCVNNLGEQASKQRLTVNLVSHIIAGYRMNTIFQKTEVGVTLVLE